ncbi:hypothetical protein [Chengkuizengella axinellae]|uniref:Uncharacterized protein n=1 Tax=Chengkuizengella axinellae TaxID=3064388 RepID=A0ABT9J5U4_9BACL|nr:hypothetical protein [Chengkuizengella sp. 2205SS18-9]MDP5276375.1 hypothetical protein [Chengkuizengella sp. 2205SS18-9]
MYKKVDILDFEFVTPRNTPEQTLLSTDPDDPTVVAEITFEDCLGPKDIIWLNSIFHIDNDNTLNVVSITHQILKNGTPIYTSITEVDRELNDDFGQIFSQQYVDEFSDFENGVTYEVVAYSSNSNVFLQGPITFTGTKLFFKYKETDC